MEYHLQDERDTFTVSSFKTDTPSDSFASTRNKVVCTGCNLN